MFNVWGVSRGSRSLTARQNPWGTQCYLMCHPFIPRYCHWKYGLCSSNLCGLLTSWNQPNCWSSTLTGWPHLSFSPLFLLGLHQQLSLRKFRHAFKHANSGVYHSSWLSPGFKSLSQQRFQLGGPSFICHGRMDISHSWLRTNSSIATCHPFSLPLCTWLSNTLWHPCALQRFTIWLHRST